MSARGLGPVALALMLAGCAAPPSAPDAPPAAPVVGAQAGFESAFVPSLAPREGRPCGDIVGLSMSGPFTAAIVLLGQDRSLIDATPEMTACVEQNGLEVEFTS